MKRFLALVCLLTIPIFCLAESTALVKDKTNGECVQFVKFTCPTNQYSGLTNITASITIVSNQVQDLSLIVNGISIHYAALTNSNIYSAGTTQSMDYAFTSNLVVQTLLTLFGTPISSVSTTEVLYANGTQPMTANGNAGSYGWTNLGTCLPSGSNTVDLGSQTLPFRQVNASNFNAVGSSFSINGEVVMSKSGPAIVFHYTIQDTNGNSYASQTDVTNVSGRVSVLETNLFAGAGSTGRVSSAIGDAGKFLKADGSWGTPAGGTVSGLRTVMATITNFTLVTNDTSKVLVNSAAGTLTNFLPSVTTSDVGCYYTIVKNGAGTLVVKAADSDRIADSGAGDTIYDSTAAETYATITVLLATETNWVVTGAHGTWVTTD